MLNIGLTSVTFRNLTASDAIRYCKTYGIDCMEWGSDVRAPIEDCLNANKTRV